MEAKTMGMGAPLGSGLTEYDRAADKAHAVREALYWESYAQRVAMMAEDVEELRGRVPSGLLPAVHSTNGLMFIWGMFQNWGGLGSTAWALYGLWATVSLVGAVRHVQARRETHQMLIQANERLLASARKILEGARS